MQHISKVEIVFFWPHTALNLTYRDLNANLIQALSSSANPKR